MRIAVAAEQDKQKISERFGRSAYFLIYEAGRLVEEIENIPADQSAGISAAKLVNQSKAELVIAGMFGPKARQALEQFGIKVKEMNGNIDEAAGQKILFPLLDNNGMESMISEHFGHAPFFGVYDTGSKELKVIDNVLDHGNPGSSPVDQITESVAPTMVYTLGIGARAITLFNEKGVCVRTGAFRKVREVIDNLDKLEDKSDGCRH